MKIFYLIKYMYNFKEGMKGEIELFQRGRKFEVYYAYFNTPQSDYDMYLPFILGQPKRVSQGTKIEINDLFPKINEESLRRVGISAHGFLALIENGFEHWYFAPNVYPLIKAIGSYTDSV